MAERGDEEEAANAGNGAPKDGELSAQQTRTALRWFVQVSRAAGLDGVINLENRYFIDFDEVDTISEADLVH